MVEQWQCTLTEGARTRLHTHHARTTRARIVCQSVNSLFHTMTTYNRRVNNNSCQCLEKKSTIDGGVRWYLLQNIEKWHYLSVVIWLEGDGLALSDNIHNITFHLWVNGRALYYFTNQFQTKHQNEILEMLIWHDCVRGIRNFNFNFNFCHPEVFNTYTNI